jgi:hypothetical protein
MKYKFILCTILCTSCEMQEIPKPQASKYKAIYGITPLATGSSFYPIYVPIIKINGK